MRNHCIREKLLSQERKLLISSYFGKAQLIPTPLLKWYIMHGLVVTKIYEVLEYKRSKCFEEFAKTVSEARRSGDFDPSQSILGAIYKLLGNSFYGKMVTNKRKQTNVVYCTDAQASLKVNDKRFMNMHEIDQDYYEVLQSKRFIKHDLPKVIAFFVYSDAKLALLNFNHDFILANILPSMVEEVCCDTDSCYYLFARKTLEMCVRPEKRLAFFESFRNYCPSPACDLHYSTFVKVMVNGQKWVQPECCKERELFDARTPRLFKIEAKGTGIIALNSKTYYMKRGGAFEDKLSSKGLSKSQNSLTLGTFSKVLKTGKSSGGAKHRV